jgi:hypothetical protein
VAGFFSGDAGHLGTGCSRRVGFLPHHFIDCARFILKKAEDVVFLQSEFRPGDDNGTSGLNFVPLTGSGD